MSVVARAVRQPIQLGIIKILAVPTNIALPYFWDRKIARCKGREGCL